MLRFAFLLSIFALTSVALADELRTVDGKTITGSVAKVTDGAIVMKTDAGDVATPLMQVLQLDISPAQKAPGGEYTDLRLIDDTLLHCKTVAVKGKELEATLSSGISVKLPMVSVLAFQRDAGNKDLKKQWEELAKPGTKRDRLIILRDGALNGLEGVLGEADAEGKTIPFKRDGADAAVPILIERIHGMIFWRPDPPTESPICKVIDQDGNALRAVKLAFDGDAWTVQTAFGAKMALRKETVARLDFNFGRLVYLSDLEPAKVVEKSGIGLVVRYKKDMNLDGEPIQLDKTYAKGLSMHAHTELEYNLGGKYKELNGLLGVDTRIGADSQALVTILCDGEKRFQKVITAKEQEPVKHLSVKDVQTLKIVVTSRNFLDLHDHVTFADARISQ
jgi:NPCBM/NEW2 domain-containing protein